VDTGDFSEAVSGYSTAAQEYEQASSHYQNMEQYAANQSDRDFAETISQCAYALSLAAGNFADATTASESGNLTSAYAYFRRGQQSLNQSDTLLNQSARLTPAWLE
jgi:ABC-type multidrug transport system fused ATPase/permease subunit